MLYPTSIVNFFKDLSASLGARKSTEYESSESCNEIGCVIYNVKDQKWKLVNDITDNSALIDLYDTIAKVGTY